MTDITADPVFQLNCVLWMLQPLPSGVAGPPNPVLHSKGYRVRALSMSLTAPPAVEAALAAKLRLRGRAAPDVVASAPAGGHWLAIECKASSFGPESTTSNQALKILAQTADLSLIAGAPAGTAVPGAAVYATRASQGAALHDTLTTLASRLTEQAIASAPTATLGLESVPGTGVTVRSVGGRVPDPGGAALAKTTTLVPAAGPDEHDPRPLYIIPFDPGVTQEGQERERCLKILLARGRAEAASQIGGSTAAGPLTLDAEQLLSKATYGISERWKDSRDRKEAARLILDFVREAVRDMRKHARTRSDAPEYTLHQSPYSLEINQTQPQQRQAVADAIIGYPLPGEPSREAALRAELPFEPSP